MSVKAIVFAASADVETDKGELIFEVPAENKYNAFVAALESLVGTIGEGATIKAVCSNDDRSHIYFIDDDDTLTQMAEFENPTSVRVSVTIASEAPTTTINVAASIRGAAAGDASFMFNYRANQENILETFKALCAEKLAMENTSNVAVYVQTEDVEAEVNGDRVFLELLSQHAEASYPLNVSLQKNIPTPVISVKVDCFMQESLASRNAEFNFSYTMNQEQLLASLKAASAHEFELQQDDVALTIVIEGDAIAIQSDQQLRDILFTLLGTEQIKVLVTPTVPKVPTNTIPVEVSFGETTSHFNFRHSLDDANVFSHFKSECAIEMELSTQDEYTLELTEAGGEVIIISSDKQLEDVLLYRAVNLTADGAIVAVNARLIPPVGRVAKIVKKVACTMDGETAAIDFAFADGQEGLLSFLIEECKGPFELFPNDEVLLYVILDNEEIPLIMDSQLVEILTNYEGGVLNLRMIDARDAPLPPPKEKTVVFNVNQDDEVTETSITYHVEQLDDLLEKIQTALKNDLFIESDRTVAIYIVDGKERTLLNNVDQVITLDDHEHVSVEVHILGEIAHMLDRQGELEVLSYEWSDILEHTFDAQDVHQVFGLLKTSEGVSLPASDPLNVHLTDFASKNRPQPIAELLPILTHWTANMNDDEVAAFCHQCRDVIDFMVSVSNAFRLRRAVTAAFRSLAVNGEVSTQELSRLLLDTGNFEPEAVEQVVDGSPSKLTQSEFSEVMTQLLGDRPQDIVDFLSAAKDVANPSSHRTEKEIGVLRRKRLRGDILHTLDGVSVFVLKNLAEDFGKSTDDTALSLFRTVASLLTAPNTREEQVNDIACRDWVLECVRDEDSAKEFTSRLSHFNNSAISQRRLTDVCHRLLSPELEPSALLQHSTGCWALGRWALKAAQLVCHNKRVPFPPVPVDKFVPKAPVLDSPVRPTTSGLSSPSRLRAQLQATRNINAVVPVTSQTQSRYDFRYSHMVNNDIGLTEEMPTYSLKDLLPPTRKVGDNDEPVPVIAPPPAPVSKRPAEQSGNSDNKAPSEAVLALSEEQLNIEEKALQDEKKERDSAEQLIDTEVQAASVNNAEEEL